MSTSARRGTRRRSERGASKRSIFSPIMLAAAAAAAVLILATAWMIWPEGEAEASFTPVDSLEHEFNANHLHGIGFDPDTGRLYLATHFGLFALEGGQLYQIGHERSDFMGFSMNPHDSTELFVSGHPQGGGNLGVLHSIDEGLNFEQIFTGVAGETVDFHGMTISAADPDWFYGAFGGQIYRSTDRGRNFVAFDPDGLSVSGLCWGVPCLAADSSDPERVYAGVQDGLMISTDGGESWEMRNDELGQVAAVKVDPVNADRLVAYTEAMGLAISSDAGLTWERRHGDLDVGEGGFVFAIALDPSNADRVFVATMNNDVFETVDGGATWVKVV